uniref:Uncharacterized protein n=1 Tax=Plectus sambesii TaxID=2011161 RepID=A0A914WKS9_9BILA
MLNRGPVPWSVRRRSPWGVATDSGRRFESARTGPKPNGRAPKNGPRRPRRAPRPRAKRQWRALALLSRRRADNNKQTISRGPRRCWERNRSDASTDGPTSPQRCGRARESDARCSQRWGDRCCTGRPRRRLSRISDRSRRQNGMRADEDDDANSAHSHLSPSQVIYSPIQSHPQHPSSKCQCHIPVSALRGGPLAPSTLPTARTGHTHMHTYTNSKTPISQ